MDQRLGEAAQRDRKPADVSSLVAELGRILKAASYYGRGDPKLAEAFQRSFRALRSELERAGPLELEICDGAFHYAGKAISRGHLDDLVEEFASRGVEQVRFEDGVDSEAFAAFVQVMTLDLDELASQGGASQALARRICDGISLVTHDEDTLRFTSSSTGEFGEAAADGESAIPEIQLAESEQELELEQELDTPIPELQNVARQESFAAEQAPFDVLLSELEECDNNSQYARVADRIAEVSRELVRQGCFDESYRAIVTLYAHCGDEQKRNAHQREIADMILATLLRGDQLQDVIERACHPDPEISVQAAQVLLQRGELVVPDLLRAIDRSANPDRRAQLNAVLIAMGDDATQCLLDVMGSGDLARARLAIRIAGELQSPKPVERLEEFLAGSEPTLRKEAALALARIGGNRPVDALVSALEGPHEDAARAAAYALGGIGQARVIGPLVRTLRRGIEGGNVDLAREIMLALGRLGRPEAAPELAAILRKRSLFKRANLKALQMAAVSALGRLPGDAAYGALAQAARSGDSRLRRAAQDALDRRAAALR